MCAAIRPETVARRKAPEWGRYHLGHAFVVCQRPYVESEVLPDTTYYKITGECRQSLALFYPDRGLGLRISRNGRRLARPTVLWSSIRPTKICSV